MPKKEVKSGAERSLGRLLPPLKKSGASYVGHLRSSVPFLDATNAAVYIFRLTTLMLIVGDADLKCLQGNAVRAGGIVRQDANLMRPELFDH